MATNLTVSQGQMSVAWSFSNDDAFGGKVISSGTDIWKFSADLTDGTGANQARYMYVAKRTLTGGTNETLDVAGSLLNQFGQTITFTAIKGIKISLLTDTAASAILVGNTGANGWISWCNATTDAIKIRNGYSFSLFGTDAAGMAVTAATADLLKVTNLDGAVTATYTIMLYGI